MRFAMTVSILGFVLLSTAPAGAQTALISERSSVIADSPPHPAVSGLRAPAHRCATINVPSNPFTKYLTFPPGLAFQLLKTALEDAPTDTESPGSPFKGFPFAPATVQSSAGTLLATLAPLRLSGLLQPSLRLSDDQNGDLLLNAMNILDLRLFSSFNGAFLNNSHSGASEFSPLLPVLDPPMTTGRWDQTYLGWQTRF